MTFEIQELRGDGIEPWLDSLGELRMRVFRDYPYLYDGSLEYERDYLRIYQKARGGLVVLVTNSFGNAIGATTCLPLAEESREFQAPFLAAGRDVNQVMYFGESVLLPGWRGHGIGKEFFHRREAHARRLGLGTTTFCAVDRPAGHPLRPAGYTPLDDFWKSCGYTKDDSLRATFSWKEIGEDVESPKTLTFWLKSVVL